MITASIEAGDARQEFPASQLHSVQKETLTLRYVVGGVAIMAIMTILTVVLATVIVIGFVVSGNDYSAPNDDTDRDQPASVSDSRSVLVNDVRLTDETLRKLGNELRLVILDGDYWYDHVSGAYGLTGGPAAGFILPDLDIGGPLRVDASGGRTGVYVNGRELHALDLASLE